MTKFINTHSIKILKYICILIAASAWISWDLHRANREYTYKYKPSYLSTEMNFKTSESTNVAIVRSDNSSLTNPSSAEINPSYETVRKSGANLKSKKIVLMK